ncbi:MAG: tetratricopeptide repeat protein, partial [Thermoanaerobaculia bacterium]
ETAQSLSDVGLTFAALGDLQTAEKWLREGLAQSRVALEPASLGLAEAQIFLADLLVRRHQSEEALALYTEALPILRAAYPADHPKVGEVEAQLARLAPTAVHPGTRI